MKAIEKTGTNYKCLECNHIWDYQDDACPNCGGSFEDTHHNLTISMKDKFEAAIYDNIAGDFDKNGHAIAVGKDIAIKAVYDLHQQAMKEKIKEILQSLLDTYPVNDLTSLFDNIDLIAKENNIEI